MSTLIRWEPAREMITLREAMDRLFEDAFTRPFGVAGFQMPAIDMYQTEDELVVKTILPGLKGDDVQISIIGDVLTIKGEFKEKAEAKEKTYHFREQRTGSFERAVSLPTQVVAEKVTAGFEDGILTIKLPKADEVKPKTITVKVK